MLDGTAISRIADIIENAQATGRTIPKPTIDYPEMSIDDGYAVQDVLLARWEAGGRTLVGFKAGLTSRAKMLQMNVSEPTFGLLMGDTLDPDGSIVPMDRLIHPRIEAELAFVMKEELAGPDVSEDAVVAATDFVQPAIEIIDSRFEKFKFDIQSVVADNTSSARFVLGGRPRRPRDLDLRTIGIVLEINGEAIGLASSGAVLGNPLRSIQILVAWLHGRGRSLSAGSIVLTGGATEAFPIAKGDVVSARYQQMGSVSFRVG